MAKQIVTTVFEDGVQTSSTIANPYIVLEQLSFTPDAEGNNGTYAGVIEHEDLPMFDKLQVQVKFEGEFVDAPTIPAFEKSESFSQHCEDQDAGAFIARVKSLATGIVSNELEVIVNFN
jgi:hypothetical protein